ncbi:MULTISPECIES: selenoneine synthase SenA [unclassified Methylibium]|uniref:selenoneine synthase SenA n=1 Tax=unclassified Methylibium TaxID=2633235 RepID=UPI0003F41076|nr:MULTISPECIES: selenoneine synthase SenA [unclassified Methylibium]EWS54358.1 Iron(II)-dependent oxidoreductase EgtB [Methylibium sp. T29]EWS58668.1 Iron(II)-dependent oxidoreductase EgtB [Methylibium sp. T29-B]
MHDASLTLAAQAARQSSPEVLADLLRSSRADTLVTFARYLQALPDLRVPLRPELNPPLWELGHIGWFQEYWIARNPALDAGARADPEVPRREPLRADADALYNSSRVAHDSRWQLALPDAEATRADLAAQLEQTLALLQQAEHSDDALYFFRLALLHEDMHHEAALYMARGLGIAVDDERWQARGLPDPGAALRLEAQRWRLGADAGRGFVFDNELVGRDVELTPFAIDAQAVRWAEYLAFVEAGGYDQPQWWSEAGARWRAAQANALPRYLRRGKDGWQCWRGGRWAVLDPREAASHLTLHEAEAWCRWAGRRLPTEAEWECAACTAEPAFGWGDVWEWTASPFEPLPGFEPHPYRDYSAPWFDGRPVLKGASHCTQSRMRHQKYRNFFQAHRNDVPAGFRSCAV